MYVRWSWRDLNEFDRLVSTLISGWLLPRSLDPSFLPSFLRTAGWLPSLLSPSSLALLFFSYPSSGSLARSLARSWPRRQRGPRRRRLLLVRQRPWRRWLPARSSLSLSLPPSDVPLIPVCPKAEKIGTASGGGGGDSCFYPARSFVCQLCRKSPPFLPSTRESVQQQTERRNERSADSFSAPSALARRAELSPRDERRRRGHKERKRGRKGEGKRRRRMGGWAGRPHQVGRAAPVRLTVFKEIFEASIKYVRSYNLNPFLTYWTRFYSRSIVLFPIHSSQFYTSWELRPE